MKQRTDLNRMLRGKTILITGGAGSVGTQLTKKLLEYPVKAIRVLDIDEHALFRLGRLAQNSKLRLLLGSITDKDRVELAGNGVDYIIHLAAIKNIEISEYNPIETIDANINGIVNLIKMSMRHKPAKFLNISTDKAVEPSTLYGTTKLLGERLVSWAGMHIPITKFATVRFGNIFETRGNVLEIWNYEAGNKKALSITDPAMKRYFFHIDEAVDFILQCLPMADHGDIFVPKMKLYKMKEIASKLSQKHKIVGVRRGEKMEEKLLTSQEMKNAVEAKNFWIIKNQLA